MAVGIYPQNLSIGEKVHESGKSTYMALVIVDQRRKKGSNQMDPVEGWGGSKGQEIRK